MTFKLTTLAAISMLYVTAIFGQGRGGRGGIPNVTPEQTAALTEMNSGLAGPTQALNSARTDLIAAAFSSPRNNAATNASVQAVRAAELALADARADAFGKFQLSANKLSADQITAFAAQGGAVAGGRGGGGGGGRGTAPVIPNATNAQMTALVGLNPPMALAQTLTTARAALNVASVTVPRDEVAIKAKADAVAAAELALANARADAFAKVQASPNKLVPDQIAAFVAMGAAIGGGGFTEPQPYNFNDHQGYVSLFDGVSLKDWDGNPKFWRAEGGSLVGESTPENPSGNTYIVYRGVEAKDFTLKFEIKVEGSGGSGLQYRSKSGIPWLSAIAANVTANVGPVNLNWMLTGPQADFWPSQVYTGQFYSENTPMRIMAWRGEVVEGAGFNTKRLMGTIGDRTDLGKLVKQNEWNEYVVIARGGTFIHIVNGQLMAVMIDDDPDSSNNQPGLFGIEIEATTKVSVRNIWLKKLK